ncbi:MAG TPA: class II fumarate hydratase [Steroidobacteraceae bacterium]|jgi:fumarate hydratase class II|nr:class II fumarate hydratase [Steroidobacteraceae bacterium]
MTTKAPRVEHDSMGALDVPATALWGAQTQRAIQNFPPSGLRMPRAFIRALGLIKYAAAGANSELGDLPPPEALAVQAAALGVADGRYDDEFPVDVFQTGSGTSSNMNANEVIATLASRELGRPVHPNDHVNMGQSSNDVVPTAIHLAAALMLAEQLLPALRRLLDVLERRAGELRDVVKTGRTHLMDAMPITMAQELLGWRAQIDKDCLRLQSVMPRLLQLAQGGTAVGTGINARPEFGALFARHLAAHTGLAFVPNDNYFESLSCQDTAVELSGQLKVLSVSLMKISNDLRWMNSGPLAGLAEIALPALQPGSSIMPGKVNPVVPESVTMIAAQVIGNDATITIAGQSGNFQLNVMLPVIAYNLLQSLELLGIGCRNLADHALAGFTVNRASIGAALERNPILVTALNPVIGYEKGAAIAKKAYAEGRAVLDVAAEMTDLGIDELKRLLDPAALTEGGIKGAGSSG